ncbi:MAG: hypothetical protein U0L58_01150 [Ruminococcus sp.]|nr:hypothetical protein [Ruminococcus sp.]MEE0855888.1 hypothetical protein [Ruminococcus sp.]
MKNKIFSLSFIMLLIVFSAFSLTVYAASDTYYSTLAFQGEHSGPTRTYTHKNISYSASAYNTLGGKTVTANSSYPKTYTVSLYRKTVWFTSEKIGSKDLSRYQYGSASWTNVGAGDYYFYFKKARDGVNVNSNNVVMKGY